MVDYHAILVRNYIFWTNNFSNATKKNNAISVFMRWNFDTRMVHGAAWLEWELANTPTSKHPTYSAQTLNKTLSAIESFEQQNV